MTNEDRIKQFEENNPPFLLYDHGNDDYGLGLPVDFLDGKYRNYCQDAFNQYAIQIGDPVKEDHFYTHGSGYEWETVFKKAFEQDERLQRLDFDSEGGGFYCYADDLALLEDIGSRFRLICEDKETFAPLVCTALAEAEQEKEYHILNETVKYHIDCTRRWSVEIITPDQHLYLEAGQGSELWKGKNVMAKDGISGNVVEINAKDLLRYHVTKREEDDEQYHIRLHAEPVQTEELGMSM